MDANRYRKSNAKHWCELCSVFVFPNKVSIKRHESSSKHQSRIEIKLATALANQPKEASPQGPREAYYQQPPLPVAPPAEKRHSTWRVLESAASDLSLSQVAGSSKEQETLFIPAVPVKKAPIKGLLKKGPFDKK